MKKKLLSTLAAVSMLSTLVTPVMAAKPSHEGDGHYSYATGSEGLVTEATFLKDSYTRTNGTSKNFIEELMAFVDDSTLAHELRYVEWYIENHDSNYPFTLDTSVDSNLGRVYCGFDSGSATLTAVITRNDGSLVKASTKLVAAAKSIQYATGFYFDNGTTETLYTGPESITGNNDDQFERFNTLTIRPTPDNAIFSQKQYEEIYEAIMVDGDLDISLRTATNEDFADGYQISVGSVGYKTATSFNGYSGYSHIYAYYPVGTSTTTTTNSSVGSVVIEINDDKVNWTKDVNIGGVTISYTSGSNLVGGSNFFDDLQRDLDASAMYSAVEVYGKGDWTQGDSDDTRFLKVTLNNSDSYEHDDLIKEINSRVAKTGSGATAGGAYSTAAGYPIDYVEYGFTTTDSDVKDWLSDLAKTGTVTPYSLMIVDNGGVYRFAGSVSTLEDESRAAYTSNNAAATTSLAALFDTFAQNNNIGFDITGTNSDGDYSELVLTLFDHDGKEDKAITMNDWTDIQVWMSTGTTSTLGAAITGAATAAGGATASDGDPFANDGLFNSKDNYVFGDDTNTAFDSREYFTLTKLNETTWGSPSNYVAGTSTPTGDDANTLRGFTNNWATTSFDYTLSVASFQRYQGTLPIDPLDNVERTIRINTNVAKQPTSLHQTSSITVAVGDTIDLTSHFKPTSTANVWWETTYDEAFFNNDSSYAYNDYGVILEDDEEVLGVREGKNKIIAYVDNTYTGKTYSAEVVVTVVPRTGVTTTVTPTSNPLTVTPGTHTTTLGGAGVQLTASYYGEATFDVNDNVLPTLQSSTNGDIQDVVAWKSNDPTVLSVSEDGFVTPLGVGTGTVTCYVPNSDFEAVFTMTVIAPVIPQEENSTSTPVPSTGVNALGQLF